MSDEQLPVRIPQRPPGVVRALGTLLLLFSVGLVSCQSAFVW